MTLIKTQEEINKIKIACRLASEVLDYITPYVKEGVTTNTLDKLCHDYIVNIQNGIPATLNYSPGPEYKPYPKSTCISLNNIVCHGIPDERILKKGDILNIDVTVKKDGYHGDTSRMFIVERGGFDRIHLLKASYECMWVGILQIKNNIHIGNIGYAIHNRTREFGYNVVKEFCGHGIGKKFHESPEILHYGIPGTLDKLKTGMVFTIEPIINAGSDKIKPTGDGWSMRTADDRLSAQWEHTVLVKDNGYEVLTLSKGTKAIELIDNKLINR